MAKNQRGGWVSDETKAKKPTKKPSKRAEKPLVVIGPAPRVATIRGDGQTVESLRRDMEAAVQEGLRETSPEHVASELIKAAARFAEHGKDDCAKLLVEMAIEVCPELTDVFAEMAAEDDLGVVEACRLELARREKELGKKAFKELVGEFWGWHETRPYMRARADLAYALLDAGEDEEAIEHLEAMLDLCPNDNLGMRYPLLATYLETIDRDGWEKLFERYPEEWSCVYEWGKVLASLLAGDEAAAEGALAKAREMNPHAEAYFNGDTPLPDEGPGMYSPGTPSEAHYCAFELGDAWEAHSEATEWLGARREVAAPPKGVKRAKRK
ncbi:MAG: tetratricopeptide repeat protein [Lacipirellulaceae bacterium]